MKRKDLLIISGVIGVIIILLGIGMLIHPNSSTGLYTYSLNSADESSNTEPAEDTYLHFNNSTPKQPLYP